MSKEYEFTIRWGEQRDTDDAEGKVTESSEARPSEQEIKKALPQFTGAIRQTPPAFSAIKIEGQRAYDLARAGEAPEMRERDVVIHELELVDILHKDQAAFKVRCGKGMYVRSLARDLALKLGTYGHIAELRRTRVGPFTIEKAIPLEKLEELSHNGDALTALLALRTALDDIPALNLTASEAQCLRTGQGLLIRPQHGDLMNAKLIFAEHQGVPVALIEPHAGSFRVVRGFHF